MLPINPKIFKAYDIRGIYGQDFDNELAFLLGQAFVALRKQDSDYQPDKPLNLAVARDMRLSSPMLKDNLIRGLITAGANVYDLDLAATPTFYFAVGKNNLDGGIIVSASHNPKEWNGFKIVRAKGEPVSGETGIQFLKEKILENKFLPATKMGEIRTINNALREETDFAFQNVDTNLIKPLRIAADPANSMGALYLGRIFDNLRNTRLSKINFNLDGTFPAHEADPLKPENLAQLQKMMRGQQADLGIATDGDGDRVFFLDETGEIVNPAILRGLLSKIFLEEKPGAKIGYDVRPGKITADLIEEFGGEAVVTRVGHSLIKEQMIKEDIYFAGESSGHFYLNYPYGCFEYPSIIILKLLAYFSKQNEPVSLHLKKYKKYFHSGEINREVKDKEAVFNKIEEVFADAKISKLDGISVELDDYWFNVRGSNTEEKVRLNLEANNEDLVEEKTEEVLRLIENA